MPFAREGLGIGFGQTHLSRCRRGLAFFELERAVAQASSARRPSAMAPDDTRITSLPCAFRAAMSAHSEASQPRAMPAARSQQSDQQTTQEPHLD